MIVLIKVEKMEWVSQLQEKNLTGPWLVKIHGQVNRGEARKEFTLNDGILFFNNCFVLDPESPLCELIMRELHDSHDFFRMLERIRLQFF